jgi:hypothetical protein
MVGLPGAVRRPHYASEQPFACIINGESLEKLLDRQL